MDTDAAFPAPVDDGCRLGDHGLTLRLDGREAYFNYCWLRDNCPSSTDPQTHERVFDIAEAEALPVPADVRLDDAALTVTWAGDGHLSRIPRAFLADWAVRGRRRDPAMVPRRLWRSGFHARMARETQAAVESDPAARLRVIHALLEDGVAIVTHMRADDTAVIALADTLARLRGSIEGAHFDVAVKVDPTNLAFTAGALEMHTDLPADTLAPGVQLLHCMANNVEGGDSLFLDGAAVAEAFRQTNPEDFALLVAHAIPFAYEHAGYDYRAHQRVIELDQDGAVSGVTISQHLADVFDLPQPVLDAYYPAFRRFLRRLRDPAYLNRFRLNAGECIVFDNHRIVHGREAYTAESGERRLRGCYLDTGELRSAYRILSRRLGGPTGPAP